MRFLIKITLILASLLVIISCSSSSYVITNRVDNDDEEMFTIFAHGSTWQQSDALALNKAKGVCERRIAKVKIIFYQSLYNGLSAEQRELVKSAGCLLPKGKIYGPYVPEEYKYRSIMKFACEYDK